MSNPYHLKSQLPYTWRVFFARYGNFTSAQLHAIPAILAGQNTLIMAATASGKTEAAIAPLLERYVLGEERQTWRELRILYICPTRALVRDLYERLARAFDQLDVSLKMKSGDTGQIKPHRPPTVLITTPESTDSLLTRQPRLFASLCALVIDEVHLFDHDVRGDHLRCLMNRIERIRHYHHKQIGVTSFPLQRVALSATVPDSAGVMARYLDNQPATLAQLSARRAIVADLLPMAHFEELADALGQRAARKVLIFCNARHDVEQVAAYLRQHLPYEAAILVHYSNLDPIMRREIETRFSQATVALCISSSTLELGVDIGSINDVVLLGPPPNLSSFLQRIGRGARRTQSTPALCVYRTPLEEMRFHALLNLAEQAPTDTDEPPIYRFRPSVLVQQIFSFLKQSPSGSLRMADLRRIAPSEVENERLEEITTHLLQNNYLRVGRRGEWRAGQELNNLLDEEDIYSNIGGGGRLFGINMVDAYSGRRIAQMGRLGTKGDTILMGGNALKVKWRKHNTFAVQQGQTEAPQGGMYFRSPPFAVPLEMSQAIAAHLDIKKGQIPRIVDSEGTWLFHFWGQLYGELLAAYLQAHVPNWDDAPLIEAQNELCLRLPFTLRDLPKWHAEKANRALHQLTIRVERYLRLGRFHSYLPPDLRTDTIIAHCDLARFERLYRAASAAKVEDDLREKLLTLV